MTQAAAHYRRRAEALLGSFATDGNRLTVLRNGDEIFPAMLDAIRASEHTIDFQTYIYWRGDIARSFAEALAQKAEAGVRVRVLLDDVGARAMPDDVADLLRDSPALVSRFRPVTDLKVWRSTHRSHRRVLVCDGVVGFTGGVGIAEEWTGDADEPQWRETHLRVEGRAVDGLRGAFLGNWAETDYPLLGDDEPYPDHATDGPTTAMVVPSSAGHGVAAMSILKRVLIDLAEEQVNITSAYLSPDEGALEALEAADRRGVRVRLLVPGDHVDKRVAEIAAQEHFEDLMRRGVQIFTYEASMLHTKTLTVDGVVADLGSANFNARSFSQDEEIDVVAFDADVAAVLDEHFEEDLRHAERVTEDRWRSRGMLQRVKENAVGLIDNLT